MGPATSNSLILYDGVCGLCNRLVWFVLKRDRHDHFRFASLQSEIAIAILRRHGRDPQALDTVYLVVNYFQPGECLLSRNEAAAEILARLGGVWRLWAKLLRLLPQRFRDWRYNLIARHRYRVFGKYKVCPLPAENQRHKFIDIR